MHGGLERASLQDRSIIWQLAYYLCGITILNRTSLERLGTLPVSVRTAVLEVAHAIAPDEIELKLATSQLLRSEDLKRVTYRWAEWWSFAHEDVESHVMEADPNRYQYYPSLDEYIQRNNLEKPDNDGPDEHYAERMFLRESFLPVFGVSGLSFLHPQVPFRISGGKQGRIDLVLRGSKKYAIEVEGASYHDPAKIGVQLFDAEKNRQRSLSMRGYTYVPFTFADIRNGRAKYELIELANRDPVLKLLMQHGLDQQQAGTRSTLFYLTNLLVRFPRRYQLYQKVALTILWESSNKRYSKIVIADWHPTLATLEIAIIDTVNLVEKVAQLYGLDIELPQIDIYIVGRYDQIGFRELFERYLELDPCRGELRVDAGRSRVNIYYAASLEEISKADYIFACEAVDQPPAKNYICDESLEHLPDPFLRCIVDQPVSALPKSTDRKILDYFARRYFLVPELKDRQYELLVKIINQESVLGILPTGYGKSLVFQLYAILVPYTTLVISPLRTLILDQIQNLHRQGLTCVESITSKDTPASKSQKYKSLQERRYRLFYISPERLRLRDFHNEIHATLTDTPIGALVVDEAHCVSEWGHDFRPAYLQIDRFRRTLESACGRKIPVIALTATASPEVRKDILNVLGLQEDAVIQQESSDRPNLSLSVWPVDPRDRAAKPKMLKHLITEEIPRILRIPFNELISVDGRHFYKNAGVIFTIYAAPTGHTTIQEGVHFIAHELIESVVCDDRLVKVHASTPPKLCSVCGSARLVRADRDFFCCLDCKNYNPKNEILEDPDWEKKILATQEAFHKSHFPLLVATKGYGMGIDKRNIRFIVHYAFASGLEGYYQEAGRAGRDNEHAHVALIYIPPTTECEEEYLNGKSPPKPPCAFYDEWRCKYDLPVLCDLVSRPNLSSSPMRV
ncbi:MAG TPA: DEAD/DEAH box helicase [Methanothrix sp.]|nr:DEAD/DEAH box helicase [Methanothrix sp.]HOL44567.1 DEAD/DEAH box helicase [Methanothrix sp.]